jgi:hypothetical protein
MCSDLDEIFRVCTFWGPIKQIRCPFFDKKIDIARENSTNFDFLSKTAHFQQFFNNVFQTTIYELWTSICVKTYIFGFIVDFVAVLKNFGKKGWLKFFFFQNSIFLNDENRSKWIE